MRDYSLLGTLRLKLKPFCYICWTEFCGNTFCSKCFKILKAEYVNGKQYNMIFTDKRRWERDVLSGRKNREDNGSEISHLGDKIAIVTQLHAIRSLTSNDVPIFD